MSLCVNVKYVLILNWVDIKSIKGGGGFDEGDKFAAFSE